MKLVAWTFLICAVYAVLALLEPEAANALTLAFIGALLLPAVAHRSRGGSPQ